MAAIDPAFQMVILARLSEFCEFHGATLYHESDPWEYMRRKLLETEPAIAGLKQALYDITGRKVLDEIRGGAMTPERYTDYRLLFERLLSVGDFADLAIHLAADQEEPRAKAKRISDILDHLRPTNLFIEERRPAEARSPSWEKLLAELSRRLEIDRIRQILARKPRTRRRKKYVLRRLRRNVAEYCSVLHIPTSPADTFTPFMLPRIEGIIAANLRFLDKFR